MAGEQVIRERDVQGVKYLDRVLPLLKRLHGAGCERDKAGNRDFVLFGQPGEVVVKHLQRGFGRFAIRP